MRFNKLSMLGLKRGDTVIGFLKIDGLEELEQNEMWEEAIDKLYSLWSLDKNNALKLCRIFSECWYVLSECVYDYSEQSVCAFKKILIETNQYGLKNFARDIDFLWLAGYMISLFPSHFYYGNSNNLYKQWEQTGKYMLWLATQIEPENQLFKVLYLGLQEVSDEYFSAQHRLAPRLNTIFPGQSAIEKYFKEVLTI